MKERLQQVTRVVLGHRSLVLAALVLGCGCHGVTHDLQVMVSQVGVSGRSVAFFAVRFPVDPSLSVPEARPVMAELASADASWVIVDTTAEPSMGPGTVGHLSLEGVKPGAYRLRFSSESTPTLDVPFRVADAPLEAVPEGRRALAARTFQAFPTRPQAGMAAPVPFDLRVLGGVCVPETVCRAVLRVGLPASAVRIDTGPTVTAPDGPQRDVLSTSGAGPWLMPGELSVETSGFVGFAFVPHGPDVELKITAYRDAGEVASRRFRLPLALGAVATVPGDGDTLHFFEAAESDVRYLDVFRGATWERCLVLPGTQQVLRDAALGEAGVRVQVRSDPFSSQNATVQLGGAGGAKDRFAAAREEALLLPLPEPQSTRKARVARAAASEGSTRRGMVGFVALLALAVFGWLWLRIRGGTQIRNEVERRIPGARDAKPVERWRVPAALALLALGFLTLALWIWLRRVSW